MKKILSLLLCAAFVIGLSGCDKKEVIPPKKITTMFLDAYLAKDAEKMKLYSLWNEDSIKVLKLQKDDYIDGIDKTLQDEVHTMMFQFNHSETKETINEDKATVTTQLTLYDFAPTLKKGTKEAEKKIEELSKKSTISDATAQKEIVTILLKNIKQAKKSKKVNVTINLALNDDEQWVVTKDNAQLQDALLKNARDVVDLSE